MMEITNGSSLTSSPLAKIPFRPRKIWKLSPCPKSSQIVVAETQTTPKPLATIKLTKSKAAHHQRAVPAAPRIVARSLLFRPLMLDDELRANFNKANIKDILVDVFTLDELAGIGKKVLPNVPNLDNK
jgi:hypothetical protein